MMYTALHQPSVTSFIRQNHSLKLVRLRLFDKSQRCLFMLQANVYFIKEITRRHLAWKRKAKIMASCNDILIHTIVTHSQYHLYTRYTATQKNEEKREKYKHNPNIGSQRMPTAEFTFARFRMSQRRNSFEMLMRVEKSSLSSPHWHRQSAEKIEKKATFEVGCGKNVEQFFADISQLNFGSNRWAYWRLEVN